MSAMSDYLENKLIDALLRGQSFTFPTTLEFALFTSATDDAGAGSEVTGAGYARAPITASLANFSGTQAAGSTDASSGTLSESSNNIVIEFPSPSGDWGTITHIAIYDTHTDGNMLFHGALTAPKTVLSGGSPPKLTAGKFKIRLDA